MFVFIYLLIFSVVPIFPFHNNRNSDTYSLKLRSEITGGLPVDLKKSNSLLTNSNDNSSKVIIKTNDLKDSHQQMIVHWVGAGSNVVICLTRDPEGSINKFETEPSMVYFSFDYGDTYINKMNLFDVNKTGKVRLNKFYIHPKLYDHIVFTEESERRIYTTSNGGLSFNSYQVPFTVSKLSFDRNIPRSFFVHDLEDPMKPLWHTFNFGETFSKLYEMVGSFDWITSDDNTPQLLIRREGSIVGASSLMKVTNYWDDVTNIGVRSRKVIAKHLIEFSVKGDYVFVITNSTKNNVDISVSYQEGSFIKAEFDTELDRKEFAILDVSDNRIFIAVVHTSSLTNLYVSDIVDSSTTRIVFTLSLDRILGYYPTVTPQPPNVPADESFTDFHKVAGMHGIYIVSQVSSNFSSSSSPTSWLFGPEHMTTLITFDYGTQWHTLNVTKFLIPSFREADDHSSLHLTQKYLSMDKTTRFSPILSSESAPGLIIATGIWGKTMKGHPSVYISRDAGLTWKQVLKEGYWYNFGDHGSIIVAVKSFKMADEVNELLYSTDEGETWRRKKFSDSRLRVYSLMTEPGENTTVFTIFGSKPEGHQWSIVKADFKDVFEKNCTIDDFKPWSPKSKAKSKMNCVMGQNQVFLRRTINGNCYIGNMTDVPLKSEPCECTVRDFTCDYGFYWVPSTEQCVRNTSLSFKPYGISKVCPPHSVFNLTKGYKKIPGNLCQGGDAKKYLPEIVACPIKEENEFLLLAQRERIRTYSLTTFEAEILPVENLINVVAVEYDFFDNCVFWADIVNDTIGRLCLNGSSPEILVDMQMQSVEGMAFDWISKHLYFVDGVRSKIEVIRTDIHSYGRMRKTILSAPLLKKPRGIAVHPMDGFFFWTDWAADNPSINRANLDGSKVTQLFRKPIVEWPNGITVDYTVKKIYWVDAKKDYIGSSDFEGHNFKKVKEMSDKVTHPFSVAVHKSSMFWDDWKQNAIFEAHKDTGLGTRMIHGNLSGLMDLKVVTRAFKGEVNGCTNNTVCSHLCFGLPNNETSCQCPDGLQQLDKNKCACPGGQEPFANGTCRAVGSTCASDFFQCNNSLCIPKGWKCDGDNDCGDNSDETCKVDSTCLPNLILCPNSARCIPSYWKCDYDMDCEDGSDELNCNYSSCKSDQFQCRNGRCISQKWVCDSEDDCKDNSDELNCSSTPPASCLQDEFRCNSTKQCIPSTWRCDTETDCSDYSDEIGCPEDIKCESWQFRCKNNKCIFKAWLCDGEDDCGDHFRSDEQNCNNSSSSTTIKPPPTVHNVTCQNMFTCSNGHCIPLWWKCDQVDDCTDLSDEIGCNITITKATTTKETIIPTPMVCPGYRFRCETGDCIPESWVCDGQPDCPGGEDETICNGTYTSCKDENQFKCGDLSTCIPTGQVCDGKSQCPNGYDETFCSGVLTPATPSCEHGYFPCDENTCIEMSKRCDGIHNCMDGTDEMACPKDVQYQIIENMRVGLISENSFNVSWSVKKGFENELEYLPSIALSRDGNSWRNYTWTNVSYHHFTNLQPFTEYNVTIYVRNLQSKFEYSNSMIGLIRTDESEPSPPLNVTAVQKSPTEIEVQWKPPSNSNGHIRMYIVRMSPPFPPFPPVTQLVPGSMNHTVFQFDFEMNKVYLFKVQAKNLNHVSPIVGAAVNIQEDNIMNAMLHLNVTAKLDNSVTLNWRKINEAVGYIVNVHTEDRYPKIPDVDTTDNTFTVMNLSPGVLYLFEVYPYDKKNVTGRRNQIAVKTEGEPLPMVGRFDVQLQEFSAKLSWTRPEDTRINKWKYAIYYGTTMEELLSGPKYQTEQDKTIIPNLGPCLSYIFNIGVVIPPTIYGPLSNDVRTIFTPFNAKAPPTQVRLTIGSNNTNIHMEWHSSCAEMTESIGYYAMIKEINTKQTWKMIVNSTNNTVIRDEFPGHYGGVYNISILTSADGAISTPVMQFSVAPIPPPHQVYMTSTVDGKLYITWRAITIPSQIKKKYRYKIWLSEGVQLDTNHASVYYTTNEKLEVSKLQGDIYSVAIQIVTTEGYSSPLSEVYTHMISDIKSVQVERTSIEEEDTSTLGFFNFLLFLLIALPAGGFLYYRYRLSHPTFTNLANSHYNTRSGSATFSGVNGLESDDTFQREFFSDDEPLVIA